MTVREVLGSNTRASRFFMPQSSWCEPLRKNPGVACGVAAAKRCPSVSASGMVHPACQFCISPCEPLWKKARPRCGNHVAGRTGLPANQLACCGRQAGGHAAIQGGQAMRRTILILPGMIAGLIGIIAARIPARIAAMIAARIEQRPWETRRGVETIDYNNNLLLIRAPVDGV